MTAESASFFDHYALEWIEQLEQGNNPFVQPEEKLEKAYSFAYSLYNNQRYGDACNFFRLLTAAKPSEKKFWKGFGACLQMQKNYHEALNCYACVEMLSQGNADPYLYIQTADCYFALKQTAKGLKALDVAQKKAKRAKDQTVIDHVLFMRDIWTR